MNLIGKSREQIEQVTRNKTRINLHNDPEAVGPKVTMIAADKFHHPWRASAWEIHPVLKLKKLE